MKTICLKRMFAFVVSMFLLIVSHPARAENEDVTEAGDYLQIILPAIAGVSTLFAGNPEGGWIGKVCTNLLSLLPPR
jgi:hypothetical protein